MPLPRHTFAYTAEQRTRGRERLSFYRKRKPKRWKSHAKKPKAVNYYKFNEFWDLRLFVCRCLRECSEKWAQLISNLMSHHNIFSFIHFGSVCFCRAVPFAISMICFVFFSSLNIWQYSKYVSSELWWIGRISSGHYELKDSRERAYVIIFFPKMHENQTSCHSFVQINLWCGRRHWIVANNDACLYIFLREVSSETFFCAHKTVHEVSCWTATRSRALRTQPNFEVFFCCRIAEFWCVDSNSMDFLESHI